MKNEKPIKAKKDVKTQKKMRESWDQLVNQSEEERLKNENLSKVKDDNSFNWIKVTPDTQLMFFLSLFTTLTAIGISLFSYFSQQSSQEKSILLMQRQDSTNVENIRILKEEQKSNDSILSLLSKEHDLNSENFLLIKEQNEINKNNFTLIKQEHDMNYRPYISILSSDMLFRNDTLLILFVLQNSGIIPANIQTKFNISFIDNQIPLKENMLFEKAVVFPKSTVELTQSIVKNINKISEIKISIEYFGRDSTESKFYTKYTIFPDLVNNKLMIRNIYVN